MLLAKAFEEAKREAVKQGKNIEIEIPKTAAPVNIEPEQIPMMYRAQVQGRCSLQFAGNNNDLKQWTKEWVYPKDDQTPTYQYPEPPLGFDGEIYRIKVEFPFRLFSNCGQDNIARPIIGKNGIPFLPGSSVKGLFRRACSDEKARNYCGDKDNLNPEIFRFLGAYPLGNWAKQINDIVHPQQVRQVQGNGSPTALALISLYKPELIFEFSSSSPEVDWQDVERILLKALQQGVGGKTSSGYGMGGNFPDKPTITPAYPISFELKNIGVSSVLRTGEPEFRPNLFKATLRGHVSRLLAGVCPNQEVVNRETNRLFGHTTEPSQVQVLWQSKQEDFDTRGKNPTYTTRGVLYVNTPRTDVDFIENVLKFAFVMGGFGKSWRRVWHKKFYPTYQKLEIGCHWESPDIDEIQTRQHLKQFLDSLFALSCDRLGSKPPKPLSWKEAWHPQRVAVYSNIVTESAAVRLFHDDVFKTTPAIGGRNPKDKRPTFVSSVWHRMLPIAGNKYLEIVTVFHGDRTPWKHKQEGNQLHKFIQKLTDKGLQLTWGTSPAASKS
ncbi:hypothetical protein J0895_25430 [Phormidium pseudopriestleyi FRX01]|uniref:RAMP superfamily protein n=1 Tax=Phormidium pseudopriestleyi FRX01 TaxID=1759528 RepID=A0ABS3G0F0_9CYAN|nr:hypothetical protein [Phormidium pseudopriestleyi]MBO0352361.1 hypothetical protein [Phormidium pseudopriestleyi FRX01]